MDRGKLRTAGISIREILEDEQLVYRRVERTRWRGSRAAAVTSSASKQRTAASSSDVPMGAARRRPRRPQVCGEPDTRLRLRQTPSSRHKVRAPKVSTRRRAGSARARSCTQAAVLFAQQPHIVYVNVIVQLRRKPK